MLLLLVPFAIAVVVVSVLGLAGIGPLTEERRADRVSITGGISPVLGVLLGGGLLALAVVGTVGLAGLSDGEDGGRRHRADRSHARSTDERPHADDSDAPADATTDPPSPARRAVTLVPEVRIEADDGDTFPASYDVADRLPAASVLQVHAVGFEPFARAVAEQCAPGRSPVCHNLVPVQFDDAGEARFQYLISDEFPEHESVSGGCRADAALCEVVVRTLDGATRGAIQTIFVDAIPPPGRIAVTRSDELALDGQRVTVEVSDYPPGAEVTAMVCAAPDATGSRCGAPGPTAAIRVDPDGTGRADLIVRPGPVGVDRISCARGDDCGISVASDDVFVRAPVIPITFAAPPGAAYDPLRLALGLAMAALVLMIAAWLLVGTDWSAVGEAAAPEIDDAEYADLDAIIAALPTEDEALVGSP